MICGSIASGGTLGIIIPPSVILVIYAYLTEQSVQELFFAALIPGLIAVVLYMVAIRIYLLIYPLHQSLDKKALLILEHRTDQSILDQICREIAKILS